MLTHTYKVSRISHAVPAVLSSLLHSWTLSQAMPIAEHTTTASYVMDRLLRICQQQACTHTHIRAHTSNIHVSAALVISLQFVAVRRFGWQRSRDCQSISREEGVGVICSMCNTAGRAGEEEARQRSGW